MPAELAKLLTGTKVGDYRLYPSEKNQYHVIRVIDVSPPEVESFRLPIEYVLERAFTCPHELITWLNAGTRRRRSRHDRADGHTGDQRIARIVCVRRHHLHADPRLSEPTVCYEILGHALRAIDRDGEPETHGATTR